jgi:uncharacterized protein DUF6909
MDDATLVAGVTRAISEFEIYARHGMLAGRLQVESLHRIYQRIQPVLHPAAANPKLIDLGALGYALARLPQNICTVRRIRLKRAVPKDFEKWNGIKSVPTELDGRPTFMVGDDEIVMVIQEDVAEVLDILSLLCCFTIECKKVREVLRSSHLDQVLKDYASDARDTSFGFSIKPNLPVAKRNQLFASLAFELGTYVDSLLQLDNDWRGQLIQKMYEIATWDHDIWVLFHSSITKGTYATRTNEWCNDVGRKLDQLGFRDRPLHVISTDLQSIEDLLTAGERLMELQRALRLTRSETLKRLTKEIVDREGQELPEPDHSYYLARLLAAEERTKRREEPMVPGVYEVEDQHQTGLRCRIFDVTALDLEKLDPRLKLNRETVERDKPVVLALERVFGSQASKVLTALTTSFSKQIRSYSVVFHAGALEGGRGTILIPSYIIKDGSQDVCDFLVPNRFDPQWLEGLTKDPVLSGGPVVTVLGIVLQSRQQLVHYNQRWKAIGVDLIGSTMVNAMNHALLGNHLAEDMEFRLLYVATDNPIREEETLAHNVRYSGVVPYNAISIALLNAILNR